MKYYHLPFVISFILISLEGPYGFSTTCNDLITPEKVDLSQMTPYSTCLLGPDQVGDETEFLRCTLRASQYPVALALPGVVVIGADPVAATWALKNLPKGKTAHGLALLAPISSMTTDGEEHTAFLSAKGQMMKDRSGAFIRSAKTASTRLESRMQELKTRGDQEFDFSHEATQVVFQLFLEVLYGKAYSEETWKPLLQDFLVVMRSGVYSEGKEKTIIQHYIDQVAKGKGACEQSLPRASSRPKTGCSLLDALFGACHNVARSTVRSCEKTAVTAYLAATDSKHQPPEIARIQTFFQIENESALREGRGIIPLLRENLGRRIDRLEPHTVDQALRGEATILVAAGFHPVSSMTSRWVYHFQRLSKDWQELIRTELISYLSQSQPRLPSWKTHPHLRAFWQELNRYQGEIYQEGRFVRKPTSIPGMNGRQYLVPDGTLVVILPEEIGKMSNIFGERTDLFHPKRYLEMTDIQLKEILKADITMGCGQRACPGRPAISPLIIHTLVGKLIETNRVPYIETLERNKEVIDAVERAPARIR